MGGRGSGSGRQQAQNTAKRARGGDWGGGVGGVGGGGDNSCSLNSQLRSQNRSSWKR